jgi:hypothetical protein
MPRSGTTLLERVLYSSPDVSLGGELPFVGRLRDEACAKFGTNQYDSMALTRVPNSVWAQLGEEYVFRARQRVADTPHFTDKMPGNYMFIGFIRTMLPRASPNVSSGNAMIVPGSPFRCGFVIELRVFTFYRNST